MSLSDLRKMNLLKPEQGWNGRMPRSAVSGPRALLWLIVAILGCVLMVLGNGDLLTWVGLALFGIALWRFVALSLRSIRGGGLDRVDQSGPPSPNH